MKERIPKNRQAPLSSQLGPSLGPAAHKDVQEREGSMENMRIGDYLVTFDEKGADIEHRISHVGYRVRGKEASTAISFVRHCWKLCVALLRDQVALLEPFKVESPQ